MAVVLLGAPGSGKGTQAEMLVKKYGFCHISMGDLLREEVTISSDIGKLAGNYLKEGKLVPDEVVEGVLKKKLARAKCGNNILFDGYPRTIKQAQSLQTLFEKQNINLNKVIYFAVELDLVVKRLSGRRNCKSCGKIYHIEFMKPENDDVCDICGGTLYQRDDDKEETIKERFKVYETNTMPLLSFYSEKGLLSKVNGSVDKGIVFEEIDQLIKAD